MKVAWLGLLGISLIFVIYCVLIGGSFSRRGRSAGFSEADYDIHNLEDSLEQYMQIGGSYPSTEQGLEALLIRPETEPLPRRWIQTILEVPYDPWDTPFRYRFPGSVNPKEPEIISAGPDKQFGTEDDLSNQD